MKSRNQTLVNVVRTLCGRYKRTSTMLSILFLFVVVLLFNVDTIKNSKNPDININLSHIMRNDDAELRIIVLTYNRHKSLRRLLHSLDQAYYFNDNVVLEIWFDRSTSGKLDRHTFIEATNFKFNKGIKYVYVHTRHVGIYGQWMATWQPSYISKEIAVIFEDDITVSPWFYRYLKLAHTKYSERTDINGFSMELNMKHGSENGKLNVSSSNIVFLYQVIGTSGFSPKRDNWIKFLTWYKKISKEPFVPLVPAIKKPTEWYAEFASKHREDTMWEMWHIYYAYHNKEWTLYPNFGYNLALTINMREKGLHFDGKSQKEDTTKLVKDWNDRFNSMPSHPIFIDTNGIQILR